MRRIGVVLLVLACTGLWCARAVGQESGRESTIVAASNDAGEKLRMLRTFALFVNGADRLLPMAMEDAIAIHLANMGKSVVSREKVESAVGDYLQQKEKEKSTQTVNAIQIGKAVGADSIIIGTMVVTTLDDNKPFVMIASFQFVEVASQRTLLRVLFEFGESKSLSAIAERLTGILKQNMR
ncbi:MAG TPA: hypothetical protein VM163_07470 [bacterium]|nr:hypothetical protein [bacterium]